MLVVDEWDGMGACTQDETKIAHKTARAKVVSNVHGRDVLVCVLLLVYVP